MGIHEHNGWTQRLASETAAEAEEAYMQVPAWISGFGHNHEDDDDCTAPMVLNCSGIDSFGECCLGAGEISCFAFPCAQHADHQIMAYQHPRVHYHVRKRARL
jgi:hypothetical protein